MNKRGMTLLEVVVSLGILVIIVVSLTQSYSGVDCNRRS
ncbi:MAG: prepilin-type N-terminal cleavage/methylation domain-containing protein [Holdemania massiliensis]